MPALRPWSWTRWCAARGRIAQLLGVGAELVLLPRSVVAGTIDGDDAEPVIDELRAAARRARLDLLAGVQGGRLIVVLGGTDDPMAAAEKLAGLFGPGPLVVGPAVKDLHAAHPPPPGQRWRGCAWHPPGRTRRARPAPTNCCPSGPSTATATPCGSWWRTRTSRCSLAARRCWTP